MHHANALIGSRTWAYAYGGFNTTGENPDVSLREFDRMAIADVRSLIHDAMLRPVQDDVRVFVIAADSILGEAQNALLKLFEEPNAHTCFYLIIPREDMLLPTLRSRLSIMAVEDSVTTHTSFIAFQKLGYSERLLLITKKLNTEDNAFFAEIAAGFAEYAHTRRNAALIQDSLMLATYLPMPGSSKKMLFEHIALTL
ncbi:hypothetical protein IPH92_00755 [Candidatus Kaiserbacteria bacterium]|nr:MAG: hypothetical protein IPH92_00755 [Candidatus Kaiserbacteria bacterium]